MGTLVAVRGVVYGSYEFKKTKQNRSFQMDLFSLFFGEIGTEGQVTSLAPPWYELFSEEEDCLQDYYCSVHLVCLLNVPMVKVQT